MNYIAIALLVLLSIKTLNFAKFNWVKKQYFQSVGVVFMVMAMVGLPLYVLFTR